MCGIAGIYSTNIIDNHKIITNELSACLEDIVHRGPDDSGITVNDNILFGHRRLSIIDLSCNAKQPFQSKDQRYNLIFNGEIYNYIELRNELINKGHNFKTKSDTEVLLKLLIEEGEDCLHKLNGMFALAFHDRTKNKLLLARDRLGKKPLFYSSASDQLFFCSELFPLRHFKQLRNGKLNFNAINSYFSQQFINTPETIYEHIHQVAPAEYLIYENNNLSLHKFWNPDTIGICNMNLEQAQDKFSALLCDAVDIRMRADVPVGVFLSGGLDSSVITQLMKKVNSEIKSFSIGFEDKSHDESTNAIEVAKYLKTDHHNETLYPSTENIEEILKHIGQPMADPSVIPFWLLCETTQKHVTVALSGDGADEILGGYTRYLAAKSLEPILKFIPIPLLKILNQLIPESHNYYGSSLMKKIRLTARLALSIKQDNRLSPTLFLQSELKELLPLSAHSNTHDKMESFKNLFRRMMKQDLSGYLVSDILCKTDSISMAHSLEVRSPFMDYRLVELALSLPNKHLIDGKIQKKILREYAQSHLPEKTLQQAKHGFSVPVSKWFTKELKTQFISLVEHSPDFISKNYINQLYNEHCFKNKDHGLKLWSIYIFLLWHQKYRF